MCSSDLQHLQASVFRAVENRRYLERAANTGVSGFIGPQGKIIALVRDARLSELFIDGYAAGEIDISRKGVSLYTRYGDEFIVICALLFIYGLIRRRHSAA